MPRPKGSKNRKTIEREELAREVAAYNAFKSSDKKLAKEIIEDFMFIAVERAKHYYGTGKNFERDGKRDDKTAEGNKPKNEMCFADWARLAVAWAAELAPYQSPTFKAIMISPQTPEPKDGVQIIRTMQQVREHLVIRGVPPEQFAEALAGPPKLIEHLEREREQEAKAGHE